MEAAAPKVRRGPPFPWLKPAVFVGSSVPGLVLAMDAATGGLGADPIAVALNELGLLALTFLVLALACTPVRLVFEWTWPARIRRMLGLFAFTYASLHLLTYAVLDQGLDLGAIVEDIAERWFILFGFTTWCLLVPLALTSTNGMVRRLGHTNWQRLHRLAYVAASLGVVHFWLREKKDHTESLLYGAVLVVLFAVRLANRKPGSPRRAA